jgi:hypothetical protein
MALGLDLTAMKVSLIIETNHVDDSGVEPDFLSGLAPVKANAMPLQTCLAMAQRALPSGG